MQRAEGRAPWALQIPQCSAPPGGSARGGWFLFKSRQRGKWRREVECGGDGHGAASWLLSQVSGVWREGATSRGRRVLLLVPLLPAPGWDRAGEGGLPLAGERAARGWLWGAALLPHPLPGMEVSPWGEEDGACSRAVWGSDPRAGAERIPKAARECLYLFATIVTSALRVVLRHSWSSGRRLLGWAGAFPYRCAKCNWLRWVWVEVPRITWRDALDSRDLCWEVYDPLLLSLGRRCVWVQYLWPHLPFIWVCLRQRRFQRPCYLHSASDHPVAWVSFRCDFSCLK